MLKQIKEIGSNVRVYRDDKTGVAIVADGSTGLAHSCHPNIDASGSISGMKNLGYWDKNDKCVRAGGGIYNISKLAYDKNDELDRIALDECECEECRKRKEEERKMTNTTTLNKKYEAVLDILGWTYYYCNDGDVEIENHSPLGEDMVEDLSIKKFPEEVKDIYEDFDVDEHVKGLIRAADNGLRGVPTSVSALVDDAREMEKMYEDLAITISKVNVDD